MQRSVWCHTRPHLSVCSILNIGQCLCVHAILTLGKKRLVSRMTLCLRPVVHESNEVSVSLLDFNNSEGTELYVIIYKERAAKLGLFGRQNTCSSSIACQTFNNLQYLICIGRMFLWVIILKQSRLLITMIASSNYFNHVSSHRQYHFLMYSPSPRQHVNLCIAKLTISLHKLDVTRNYD